MPELNPLTNEQIFLKKIAENTGSNYNTGDVSEINPLTIDQILLKEIAANTTGLSGDITELERKVEGKADNTATASGEALALAPTSEGKALIHTAYGMSVQDGTPTPSVPVDIESAKADFISTDGENTQNVTTNLTLRAIEVSSTDDYNLVRDNKYYIADTLDYSEDNGFVVTRRLQKFEVDGSEENWSIQYSGGARFSILYTTDLGYGTIKYPSTAISSHYVYGSGNNQTWGHFRMDSGGYLVIHNNDTAISDLSTLKTWLGTNKPNFEYILETPTTETITTEQALALLSLKTYDESTSISSQAEPSCTVAIEYAKERLAAVALIAHNLAKGNDLRIAELEETP